MFQITGDRKYSDLAWGALEAGFLQRSRSQLGGNYAREYARSWCCCTTGSIPLSDSQRATFLGKLNDLFNVALTNLPTRPRRYARPIRIRPSGSTSAWRFSSLRPPIRTARPQTISIVPLSADSMPPPAIARRFATPSATTSEWRRAANGSRVRIQHRDRAAVAARRRRRQTATGEEHFPEVTRWLPEAARRPIYMTTPDLKQAFQWGDTEHPESSLAGCSPGRPRTESSLASPMRQRPT